MTGKTASEKILARASGLEEAQAGEVVEATPDLVLSHENTYLVNRSFKQLGIERPWAPDRLVVVLDHRTPANTLQTAMVHTEIRRMVREFDIKNFFDVGEGICHDLLVEKKLAKPGQLVVGADSHTTTAGAVGAFATGVGATELAGVWATGKIWLKVPETIQIDLNGHLSPGCFAKDIALHLCSSLGPSGADYKCVEFGGSYMFDVSVAGRMVLCNMATEMGAKAALIPADSTSMVWYSGVDMSGCGPVRSDPDASMSAHHKIDISKIPPMVSGPHRVEEGSSVERLEGKPVQQAFIGTCTNGRLEDLVAASWILRGRKVASGCRLLVAPASRAVLSDALDMGVVQMIVAAGGTILSPGCGPCLGAHEGVLAPGETCISSSNRNFRGRMGCEDAEVYLASPATVAASAVNGEVTDPRRYLHEEL